MTSSKTQADPFVQIALQGLVSARWVLLLIVVAVGIVSAMFPSLGAVQWSGEGANTTAVIVTVFIWGGTNFLTSKRIARLASYGPSIAGLHLVGDVVALAVLIGLTGGAANPFTVLFVVPITLATQVSPRWTWGTAIVSVIAFGILLEVAPGDSASHAGHMSDMAMQHMDSEESSPYSSHLRGMLLSLGLAGALITLFVHRIALGIAEQRNELSTLRDDVRRERELASIGSLAAGAAHELGTPLATLSVLASELVHMSPQEKDDAIDTMRKEIARCKRIITSMAAPELRAEALSLNDVLPWQLSQIEEDFEISVRCEWDGENSHVKFIPMALVVSVTRELIKNACTASSSPDKWHCDNVDVHGTRTRDGIRIIVRDRGSGMSEDVLASATDPFFSTKGRPENMGLGLFLVSGQLRAYGGKMSIESTSGEGTIVEVTIPEKADE